MTVPAGDERRSLIQWIDDAAGLGALRSDALVTMLGPFGCTVRADRGATGLRSVHVYGPTPVVEHLRGHLDALLAELDTAAKAATRRYSAWLRAQDEPDHMPAERRNLTRAYRRQYLPAWAAAWAGRLSDLLCGADTELGTAPSIGHTSAHTTAGFDVARLDPQPLTVAATLIRANDPCRRHQQPVAASVQPPVGSIRPDGPGRIAPGQRITCLPGSLPARDGGRGGGILVAIGPKTSVVDVYGGGRRRISNELLHPQAGPWIAGDRDAYGLRTTSASGRGWLPGWSWLGWTIAEHLEYVRGERRLPAPPPAPKRLVIVACGSRKAACFEAPAGQMYTGSYHRAARRAANAISTPGTRIMILSARHGLLDLGDRILRYEMRLGQRYAIAAQGLREQAEQLGLLDTAEVVVLAPAAYAALAADVWPHAQLAFGGTRGIGDQMARLTALATGRATLADLVNTEPGATVPAATQAANIGPEHTVSIHGGLVHLADTPGRFRTLAPLCSADQPGRRWRPTHAAITCTRCATVVARRRALDRWCAMVDRTALAADTRTTRRTKATAPPARTGPTPCRPATHGGQRASRPPAGRWPGDAPRRRHPDGWRLVPARPYVATPLTWSDHPGVRDRPRRGYPRYPRAPIGRAPPQARHITRRCGSPPGRWPAGQRPGTKPLTATTNPLTPRRPLTRENAATRNRSANGARRTSTCTTRPSPASGALADPRKPATAQRHRDANTIGSTRGLDRTPEVRPVTDLTTRPVETATPEPALVPAPVNGAPVGDLRTQRHASRAEQERLSADAEVERRARAARLDLELREQRWAAARREREAEAQNKQVRAEQRRTRRAVRRARLRAAAPLWAERGLFVLPIMFPMAVAWAGQIRFAMAVMRWPLPAAIVFAAGFELSTAYVARLDWRSRAAGDNALLFRAATWGFAAGAAVMNYWHAAGPDFTPTGEAVSYALMSITGVVLWELLSTYRHRLALRAEGKLPAARPRFGLARWIWFAKLTRLAWLIALRDGHPRTDLAWRAALGAVDLYGSARAARKAVRAGRPVPRPQPLNTDDGTNDDAGTDDAAGTDHPERVSIDSAPPADTTDPGPGTAGNDPTHRDSEPNGPRVPVAPARPDDNPATGNPRDSRPDQTDDTAANGRTHARADAASAPSKRTIDGAVRAQMEAYARTRLAEGTPITGADLDRQFGTSDYGRKVLRRLTAASDSALRWS